MTRLQRVFFQPNQFDCDRVNLTPDQSRYLTKVLRLRADDQFIAMDGQGHWWSAALIADGRTAELVDQIQVNHELPVEMVLAAAPAKGKGFEELIHSATELGVRHIYPLLSERTQVHPRENKLNRWQKIAIEASEQSLRQFVPLIHRPITVQALIQELNSYTGIAVLFCSTQPQRQHLLPVVRDSTFQTVAVLTGPEGGWSPAEERLFEQMNWTGVSLGRRVLRAVTAPVCALSLIASHLEHRGIR